MLGLGEGDNFAAEKLALLLEKIQHWKSSKSRKEMCILLLDFLWMNSICYKLKDVPTTPGIAFASWDTRKTIGIFYYISNISKLRRTSKLARMFLGFTSQSFHKKTGTTDSVFLNCTLSKTFFFFQKRVGFSWKVNKVCQIFVTLFYLLCVLSNQIKKNGAF